MQDFKAFWMQDLLLKGLLDARLVAYFSTAPACLVQPRHFHSGVSGLQAVDGKHSA